ncbi:hypothetical protein DXT99_13765 [Pontibacter diazotrophicus]|uniref:DUF4595 domain-containing protein n=1 Tax=Pontibacter diazotrophicus TaxID=1400979 RepID=A0A3D8LAQ6_9BACT|nr:hypothetical protein [Pontibacter diazotrophicus]RDV14468.1 hypothetical protein DXT99_13765 [Pontibacter diazotrophicus]
MQSKLLYLLAVLFLFSGCSESIEEDPAPEKTYYLQRKLSEISFLNTGGGMIIDLTYSYNELDQLTRISGVLLRDTVEQAVNTVLDYDGKGRVNYVQNNRGTTWTNTYNDKNQLIKLVRAYKDSEPGSQLLIYNEDNQLVEVKTYRQQNGAEVYSASRHYTYMDGNQISIKTILASGEESRSHTIATDDKKRPLPVLPIQIAADFSYAEVFGEGIFTRNNVVSSAIRDAAGNRITGGDYDAHYTYNEAGYPLTCVKLFDHGSMEKITYVYTSK